MKLSQKELQCLALNIFHEARGESLAGQIGVAQVTLNRVAMQHRGKKTICAVVFDPKQFSWTDRAGKSLKPTGKQWQAILQVAHQVSLGMRVHGLDTALYFHRKHLRTPWQQGMQLLLVIDNHLFWSPT